jgi:DNA-binding transcriptional MerR regulator/GGDEF domain-containing protein
MDVRSKQSIWEHLQKADVQTHILQNIQRGRDEATVTISRAAELFGITENKLRDWEEYGFLNPLRPGGPKGRRLYTPIELDKLAIIRELINAGYSASDIPPDIYKLWNTIRTPKDASSKAEYPDRNTQQPSEVHTQSINQRISQAQADLFWRYFVNHILRLSLELICENIPNTTAGLILPLATGIDTSDIQRVEELASLGDSLVGWLSQSGSSHALITNSPWFKYSSDFRIEHLQEMKTSPVQEGVLHHIDNRTLIILPRETNPLVLSNEVITTIHRLLQPLYTYAERYRACLEPGMRDILDPATDLNNPMNYEDAILNGLADMVIHLGDTTATGQARWRLCWILLPRDTSQSVYMSDMVIRAQNQDTSSTLKLSLTAFDKHPNNPYIKALQSRHVVYQANIPVIDSRSIFSDLDTPIRSAIAIPIGGEGGLPLGILYVAAQTPDAFSLDDQRVLRVMNRLIEEIIRTYQVRQQATQRLTDMIKNPVLVDTLFEGFASENDFNRDIETLLQTLQGSETEEEKSEKLANKVVSLIAIDIDRQSSLAYKYGGRLARNLTHEVGFRVQEQIRTFFKEYPECQLYHLYADRFLILLKNTPLAVAREHAERLRMGTAGPYKLDALRIYPDQHTRSESMIELTDVTIRLGITSYPYLKLREILHEHTSDHAITEVRSILTSALDVALVKGQIEGGNVVISWDYDLRNFIRWSPTKTKL